MRDLLAERAENKDRRASLAIDMFCRRIQHYIGSYLAVLEGAQAIVFTGGIGQRAWEVRQQVCKPLRGLGLILDETANRQAQGDVPQKISSPDSPLEIWVIPTDEELLIARDTVRCLNARAAR
jgi:acetate kinase